MVAFKVVTVGDSVAWGQGLRPEQKFDQLAALDIAQAIGAAAPQIENRAHSGATINPSDGPIDRGVPSWQEVPNGWPTILEQSSPPDPNADLVIIVGGINDIDFTQILNPIPTDEAALEGATRNNCYDSMKVLPSRVREQFPSAVLVVVGYYSMLSELSDLDILRLTASLLVLPDPVADVLIKVAGAKRVTRRVRYFHRSQLHWLRSAVSAAHADANVRGPGVLFAHPAFGPWNSVGAPAPLLFSPARPASPEQAIAIALRDPFAAALMVDPDDPVLPQRRAACAALRGAGDLKCRVAAIGHPNPAGARRYADAIKDVYLRSRRLSLRSILTELLDAQPSLSLRRALGRFGLLASPTSARDCLQHATVDCIAATIRTKDELWAGTNHAVFLRVAPEREWRLNESVFEGDLFDDFERGKESTYYIDPAEGDPGNRLRLPDIKEVTLVLRVDRTITVPEDPTWRPETLRFAINGREVLSATVDRALSLGLFGSFDAWTVPDYPQAI